ncbi:MAG: hypothetical protein QM664_10775 [Flavihumibacter sp.]
MNNQSKGLFSAIRSLILPATAIAAPPVEADNNAILAELVDCFDRSCKKESVGSSLLFNMHFLVVLHPAVYADRLASFPVVAKEAVKAFYKKLQSYKQHYEEVSPVSMQWSFRFGEGDVFNGEKLHPGNVHVIGMLTGGKENMPQPGNTTKVTMKSRRTNLYEKMDINLDLLQQVNFIDTGSFTVRYSPDLRLPVTGSNGKAVRSLDSGVATIKYYLADKNIDGSYTMRDREMVIARKGPANQGYSNYLLIDSSFVSDPHARIRLNESSGRFEIASFSRFETRVNEELVPRSEAGQPKWFDLPNECQVLLNASVTLHFSTIN